MNLAVAHLARDLPQLGQPIQSVLLLTLDMRVEDAAPCLESSQARPKEVCALSGRLPAKIGERG